MQVSLCVLGEVEVDDNVDSLDVDTSGEEICSEAIQVLSLLSFIERGGKGSHRKLKLTSADQVSAQTISEIVEHTVSIFLRGRQSLNILIQINPQQTERPLGCAFC